MRNTSQTAIPCLFMRGGTSKGPFFKESDLPSQIALRDRVLLSVMGSPDKRQIDGLGGAHPLTSKVGIVRPSASRASISTSCSPNCSPTRTPSTRRPIAATCSPPSRPSRWRPDGRPAGPESTFRVLTLNTDMQCDITVQTPGGVVEYEGDARIDGAPGTSAPIKIKFLDTAGSVCSGLLPTGNVRDTITVEGEGFAPFTLDVTCIDNGMPLVMFKASDVGRTGYESVAEMNADEELSGASRRCGCRFRCAWAWATSRRRTTRR